jgi:hypothetical protein
MPGSAKRERRRLCGHWADSPDGRKITGYDGTRRYLVITRHLNARILSDLGGTFQIDNLLYPAKSTI